MIKQFRNKSVSELQKLVNDWKAELLALRFQRVTGQLDKSSKFKELKVAIARALTIINESKLNINQDLVKSAREESTKKSSLLPKHLIEKIGLSKKEEVVEVENTKEPFKEKEVKVTTKLDDSKVSKIEKIKEKNPASKPVSKVARKEDK